MAVNHYSVLSSDIFLITWRSIHDILAPHSPQKCQNHTSKCWKVKWSQVKQPLIQCDRNESYTRSQAVARIADRTASQHLWGHLTLSVTWPFYSPHAMFPPLVSASATSSGAQPSTSFLIGSPLAYGVSNGHVPMTSRNPQTCSEAVRSAILATAWPYRYRDVLYAYLGSCVFRDHVTYVIGIR